MWNPGNLLKEESFEFLLYNSFDFQLLFKLCILKGQRRMLLRRKHYNNKLKWWIRIQYIPAIPPDRNSFRFWLQLKCWSIILLVDPWVTNMIADMGVRPIIGDKTPLKNPLIPSWLYIILTVGSILVDFPVYPLCILTFMVSKGWEMKEPAIPEAIPAMKSILGVLIKWLWPLGGAGESWDYELG